eukprot:scaffold3053_cov214-Prasinococcus_capsulatus_cf.AAC.3
MARAHSISLPRTWEASAQQLPRSTQPLSQAHPLASGRGGALHSSLPQITASRASGSYDGSMKSAAPLPPSQSSGEHLSTQSAKITHSFAPSRNSFDSRGACRRRAGGCNSRGSSIRSDGCQSCRPFTFSATPKSCHHSNSANSACRCAGPIAATTYGAVPVFARATQLALAEHILGQDGPTGSPPSRIPRVGSNFVVGRVSGFLGSYLRTDPQYDPSPDPRQDLRWSRLGGRLALPRQMPRVPRLEIGGCPQSERTCPSDRLGKARPAATTSEAAAPHHLGRSPANGKRVTRAPAGQHQPPSPRPVLWKLARPPPPSSPARMRSGESYAHILSLALPGTGRARRQREANAGAFGRGRARHVEWRSVYMTLHPLHRNSWRCAETGFLRLLVGGDSS